METSLIWPGIAEGESACEMQQDIFGSFKPNEGVVINSEAPSSSQDDLENTFNQLSSKLEVLTGAPLEVDDGCPQIEFIEAEAWKRFIARIERNKRENQALIDTAKSIENAGGCTRKLQKLAPDWETKVDQFEDVFPNFSALAVLLRDYFTLSSVGDMRVYFPPLLLVGEAGIGKTEAARWLSNNFRLPFRVMDMASAQTGATLSGSERFWANTKPGQLFELLAYEQYANPIFVLDELDKVTGDARYDPFAPLYTLLEPSSARNFADLSINDFSINASHLNWIATANDLSSIPFPLQTRFTIVAISKPTEQQAAKIIMSIYTRLLSDSTWGGYFNSGLHNEVIDKLLIFPPRVAKSILIRALGSAIRNKRHGIECEDLVLPKMARQSGMGFLAPQQ